MKRPKNPTYRQKQAIVRAGLDWKEWLVSFDRHGFIGLIHKKTGESKMIDGGGS